MYTTYMFLFADASKHLAIQSLSEVNMDTKQDLLCT